MQTHLSSPRSDAGNPILNIAIFVGFIVVTMAIVTRASKSQQKDSAKDFYTGGASFSGTQNGLAIAGDYLSAASFLGIVGAIATDQGYDGFLYSIGFFVAWVVAMLLVAEPLRNTGKFTMADVLSFRLKQRPVRLAASSFATLFVSLVLPDRADGRCRLRWSPSCSTSTKNARSSTSVIAIVGIGHDRLRPDRRHEGHDLRPDDQGRAAVCRCVHHGRHHHGHGQGQLLRTAADGRRRARPISAQPDPDGASWSPV
jgi:hypothetical protein